MASNALSGRRGPLRRPKVCQTPTNPGRCEDPPTPPDQCIHSLDAWFTEESMPTNDETPFWATGINDCYEQGDPLVAELFAYGGTIDPFAIQKTDYDMDTLFYSGDWKGQATVVCMVTWPNGNWDFKIEHILIE